MGKGYSEQASVGEGAADFAHEKGGAATSDLRPLGHHPVIPPRIGESADRLDPELLERFRVSAVPDISDAVGRLYTMDNRIRPLYEPMRRVVGVALTVKLPPGDNWAIHGALSRVQQGDVLVVDWQGYDDGCGAGAKVLVPAIRRGLTGVVVDGGWRDIGDLQALDFPMCGRAVSAFSPAKYELGEINVPVCCGGVIVEPGDVVVADREGSVVVPRRHAAEVARHLPDSKGGDSDDGYPHNAVEADIGRIAQAYEDAFEARGGSYEE